MKLARALSEAEAKKVQTFVLLGGALTTFAIWTNLEDPINLPKMVVLVLFAAIVLGLVSPALFKFSQNESINQKIGIRMVALFGTGLLISTLATDVKHTSIFGEYHRNNGALTFLAFIVLITAAGLVFSRESILKPLKWLSFLGLILSAYGLLQFLGQDPVKWNNQYNPLITTLGNPNFTSGFIGIASIASLYFVIESKSIYKRSFSIFNLVLGLFVIVKSNSVQGIFAFICGAAVVIFIKAWEIKRVLGFTVSTVLTIIGILVALAIFNIGPLASRLFQSTLNNRLDYWQAAINMFKAHPLLGVGIDRYGEYYREFAVQDQYVQGVFTNNAHNVYLHILATGGLILFIPYILLIGYVSWLAISTLIKANKEFRTVSATYLGIWLGLLLLNIVTVDNIGVGVWFWIIGGVIIGNCKLTSLFDVQESKSKKNKRDIKSTTNLSIAPTITAFALALFTLVTCAPLLNISSKLIELKYNVKSLDQKSYALELIDTASENASDPQTLANLTDFAIQINDMEAALKISKMIEIADSRSFYASFLPAIIYENSGRRDQAIPYRERLLKIDKWNTSNMLELVKSYIEVKNTYKAIKVARLINELYPGSENSAKAQALIKIIIKQ